MVYYALVHAKLISKIGHLNDLGCNIVQRSTVQVFAESRCETGMNRSYSSSETDLHCHIALCLRFCHYLFLCNLPCCIGGIMSRKVKILFGILTPLTRNWNLYRQIMLEQLPFTWHIETLVWALHWGPHKNGGFLTNQILSSKPGRLEKNSLNRLDLLCKNLCTCCSQ